MPDPLPILAIDPGNVQSAYVVIDRHANVIEHAKVSNETLLDRLADIADVQASIEWIESFGMSVGQTVFRTCAWIGRFEQRWLDSTGEPMRRITRRQVKIHHCQNYRAKDANVRQAVVDRYDATGGGANPVCGTKNSPGPLYGISKDEWSALAIALLVLDVERDPMLAASLPQHSTA